MTAIPATPVEEQQASRPNYLNVTSSFMSWAGTLDHKRIGLMYLVGVTFAFLVGGLFALLVRLHLWNAVIDPATGDTAGGLFNPEQYNQYFTMHGAFMVK